MTKKQIKKVAIIGGTHGNELTGVYLVKNWFSNLSELQRGGVESRVFYANPNSTKIMKRYVDQDLNRSFLLEDLINKDSINSEQILAKELNKKIGPKGAKKTNFDFIIDLHSTTSNMGQCLILDNDSDLSYKLVTYLQKKNKDIKIFLDNDGTEDVPYITSILPENIVIEVGPIANGVLDAKLFLQTEEMVNQILDFMKVYNTDSNELNVDFVGYKRAGTIDYPRDGNGEINAMIHQDLQFKDYHEMRAGDNIFLKTNGKKIKYTGGNTYPIFINEAAYYEKGVAMVLTKKVAVKR